MINGFFSVARTDVRTATTAPTSRSSSSGNDTTLMLSTPAANKKPTPLPTMISVHPARVVKTRRRKSGINPGGV